MFYLVEQALKAERLAGSPHWQGSVAGAGENNIEVILFSDVGDADPNKYAHCAFERRSCVGSSPLLLNLHSKEFVRDEVEKFHRTLRNLSRSSEILPLPPLKKNC